MSLYFVLNWLKAKETDFNSTFGEIFTDACKVALKMGIDTANCIPRRARKQTQRNNIETDDPEEYFR